MLGVGFVNGRSRLSNFPNFAFISEYMYPSGRMSGVQD